jgi:hypothetical protein
MLIAFGEEFDKLAAASASYSRQFTALPIQVVTNLKNDDRHRKWAEVPGVEFSEYGVTDNHNRYFKTKLLYHSFFDQTLFMDADAVIQKPGIEQLFEHLDDCDLACQYFGTILCADDPGYERDFVAKTYDKLAKLLKEPYPIELFAEAALLFKKSGKAYEFFSKWYKHWELMGSGRDMPAFCFAVKHLRSCIRVFGKDDKVNFCKNAEDENAFIQHKGFSGFEKKFGLPEYIDWNPVL